MSKKISLFIAILLNINIVVGGGFFLSAREMSLNGGALAPLSWLLVGCFLLPLILVLADLSKVHPTAGGLYVFSHKHIRPFWGFVSGWGYYVGTAVGNAAILHGFGRTMEKLGFAKPLSNTFGISGTNLDLFFMALFVLINFFNIKLLSHVQGLFTILKAIPFLLVIGASFFLFNTNNIILEPTQGLSTILGSIPIVLFAYIGIEACCAIGHLIEEGEKNTAKATLISFGIIISIYALIQFLIGGIYGSTIGDPFTGMIPMLTNNPLVIKWGTIVVQLAILSSFLGGFYSMFYANNWNLYAMAQERKLPLSNYLTKQNSNQAPWVCTLVQAALIAGLLVLTSNLESLMTMSDVGIIIAYLLSTVAFLLMSKKGKWTKTVIGVLSLTTSSYMLWVCFANLNQFLIPYSIVLGIGLMGYWIAKN